MAMFTTYYDTSGAEHDQPVMVTVGLIASEKKWLTFERNWRKALKEFHIPYVHMSELVHNNGPFSRFKGDEPQKRRLFTRLFQILRQNLSHYDVSGLSIEDFREVSKEFELSETFGSAFALCVNSCVERSRDWLKKGHPGQPLEHFHEDDDFKKGTAIALCDIRGTELRFKKKIDRVTKEWFVPFQGADFLAWELRRGAIDMRNKNAWRKSFKVLMTEKRMRGRFGWYEKDNLLKMCQIYPHLFPRKV